MTSSNLQDWFYVELTLKSISDATTTTYKISSRAVIDDSTQYYPLLKGIDGVGARMSDVLPYSTSGSITINNEPGSFGFERRFSDLLDRYTIIDQSVKIYAAQTAFDDLNVTADFSLAYTAKIKEWSADVRNNTLNIVVAGTQISARYIGAVIDSNLFSSAPATALGKAVPIVFGSYAEVPAILLTEVGNTTPSYAYGSDYATTFLTSKVNNWYTKQRDGQWAEVQSASVVSTTVFGDTTASSTYAPGDSETAFWLAHDNTTYNYIITQFELSLHGQNSGGITIDGDLVIRVYEGIDGDSTLGPGELIDTITADAADYQTDSRGVPDVWEGFTLSKPLVLTSDKGYWISVQHTTDAGANYIQWKYHTTSPIIFQKGYIAGYAGTGWHDSGNTGTINFKFYGVKFTDGNVSSVNQDGYAVRYFTNSQKTALTGIPNPDISQIPFICRCQGIRDDSSGTITGSASSVLSQPKHVANLLDRYWNGSAWVAGQIDFTQFTSTHNSNVTVAGAFTGRTTLEQALGEICRNTASKIALINGSSKQLGFYQWGTTLTASAVITDEDSQVERIESRGLESVVNRLMIYYDRRFRDLDLSVAAAQGQFKNYAATLNWYPSYSVWTTYLSDQSEDVYGQRPLAASGYDFFTDSTSAEWIARYLLSRNAFPAVYVTLVVPFFKYRTLEVTNVIEILHPDLPAYFGTSPNAKLPTYSGTDVDITDGHYWKRAQRYRAQIESKENVFNIGGESSIKLGCRLLLNSPKDMT